METRRRARINDTREISEFEGWKKATGVVERRTLHVIYLPSSGTLWDTVATMRCKNNATALQSFVSRLPRSYLRIHDERASFIGVEYFYRVQVLNMTLVHKINIFFLIPCSENKTCQEAVEMIKIWDQLYRRKIAVSSINAGVHFPNHVCGEKARWLDVNDPARGRIDIKCNRVRARIRALIGKNERVNKCARECRLANGNDNVEQCRLVFTLWKASKHRWLRVHILLDNGREFMHRRLARAGPV